MIVTYPTVKRLIRNSVAQMLLFSCFIFAASFSHAAELDDLKNLVEQKNKEIARLQAEAEKYRQEIGKTKQLSASLKREIQAIDTQIKKLTTEISIAENSIEKSQAEIKTLGIEISSKEESIRNLHGGIKIVISDIAAAEQTSAIEVLLQYGALSQLFRRVDQAVIAQQNMIKSIEQLRKVKSDLSKDKSEEEKKKQELEAWENNLRIRQQSQGIVKKDRAVLLGATQSQEQKYQALLKEQEEKEAALEAEIEKLEEKIRITIDPLSLPPKGTGAFAKVLPDMTRQSCGRNSDDANCVTQYFGNTSFSAGGAYQGKGHNGMDFRASVGTPVLAAARGNVVATGDTDIECPRASYGKWILIRHPNNLSTLYAHLSSVNVSQGQTLTEGDTIGLSGRSGYATGPHLHFTVMVTQASRIISFPSVTCGKRRNITVPVAGNDPVSGVEGYQNPLDFLR